MALPVTITGISTAVAPVGPFKVMINTVDTYFFFGRPSSIATSVSVWRSTAPDTSWSLFTSKSAFTTAVLNIAGYQVGTTIHLMVMDGTAATSVAAKYLSFDALTGNFLATTETIMAASATAGQSGAQAIGCSLVVRPNGEVVAFYNSLQTNTSGTPRARVSYSRRTGVNTWAAAVRVDANTAAENTSPVAVLGAANRVHFFWTLGGGSTPYRTLSAANALSTAGSSTMGAPGDGVSYDRAGVIKVVVTNSGNGTQQTLRLDSSDNPTVTFADQSLAITAPHRIGVDTSTNDVTIIYRTSGPLEAIKSTNDGATFGAPVSFFAGTVPIGDVGVSRNSSGGMYQRGNNVVVGYIVNDNGTWKYNEYFIRYINPLYSVTENTNTTFGRTGANNASVAQSLTVPVGKQWTISACRVAVSRNFSPVDGVVVELRSGSQTGTLLGTSSELVGANLGPSGATQPLVEVTFANVVVPQGTNYVVLRRTGSLDLSNYYTCGLNSGNPYADGIMSRLISGSWDDTSFAPYDLSFEIAGVEGDYVPSGPADYPLVAQTGTVTLSGKSVALKIGRAVPVNTGAITLSGKDVTLTKSGAVLSALTGTVTLTGQSATLCVSHKMLATTGARLLNGQNVTLRYGYKGQVNTGAFTLTGQTVDLRHVRRMVVLSGNVALLGQNVLLTYERAAARNIIMTVTPGAFTLDGQPVGLRSTHSLITTTGSVSLSGKSVTLRIGRSLITTTGTFTSTGQNVALRHSRNVRVGTGSIALTGQPIVLRTIRKMPVTAGSFVLFGQSIFLGWSGSGRILAAQTGAITLSGKSVILRYPRKMVVTAGAIALSGKPIYLRRSHKLITDSGLIILDGKPVELIKVSKLTSGMKIWTGSGWLEYSSKVWTGSSWMAKPTKVWNGSSWV